MNNNNNKINFLVSNKNKSISTSSIGGLMSSEKILQSYMALVILGYFGIKIVYAGFFKMYPDKYNYRSVQISSNALPSLTEDITLTSYIPGVWNNEMTDFALMVILAWLVYIFTGVSNKKMFGEGGLVDPSLIIGFIIGLGFPIYMNMIKGNCKISYNQTCMSQSTLFTFIIAIIILVFVINFKYPSENKSNYYIYMLAILLLIVGLYMTRKISKNYSGVTYYNYENAQCSSSNKGVLQSSGDQLVITPAFASFIVLLFFAVDPPSSGAQKILYFIFGWLLGILISSISYYGIDYFLIKTPEKQCSSVSECKLLDMPVPEEDTENSGDIDSENTKTINNDDPIKKNMNIIKYVMTTLLVIMIIYFVYLSFKKK